jgi:uncharacterized membrane protein YheB (UPF0754 family)
MIYLIPFATAFIGWLTNFVAIKMLFKPRTPIMVMGHPILQGLIPKRQPDMAKQCADIIERELLQQDMLGESIRGVNLLPHIEAAVNALIDDKFQTVVKLIAPDAEEKLKTHKEMIVMLMVAEIEKHGANILSNVASDLSKSFNIREIVETRIANFDLDQLENIVWEVSRKEFKTIEYIGGVLGFVIGLVQILVLL